MSKGSTPNPVYEPTREEFHGHPTIALPLLGRDDGKAVRFGLKKAEAILQYVDEIKAFVEENKDSASEEG